MEVNPAQALDSVYRNREGLQGSVQLAFENLENAIQQLKEAERFGRKNDGNAEQILAMNLCRSNVANTDKRIQHLSWLAALFRDSSFLQKQLRDHSKKWEPAEEIEAVFSLPQILRNLLNVAKNVLRDPQGSLFSDFTVGVNKPLLKETILSCQSLGALVLDSWTELLTSEFATLLFPYCEEFIASNFCCEEGNSVLNRGKEQQKRKKMEGPLSLRDEYECSDFLISCVDKESLSTSEETPSGTAGASAASSSSFPSAKSVPIRASHRKLMKNFSSAQLLVLCGLSISEISTDLSRAFPSVYEEIASKPTLTSSTLSSGNTTVSCTNILGHFLNVYLEVLMPAILKQCSTGTMDFLLDMDWYVDNQATAEAFGLLYKRRIALFFGFTSIIFCSDVVRAYDVEIFSDDANEMAHNFDTIIEQINANGVNLFPMFENKFRNITAFSMSNFIWNPFSSSSEACLSDFCEEIPPKVYSLTHDFIIKFWNTFRENNGRPQAEYDVKSLNTNPCFAITLAFDAVCSGIGDDSSLGWFYFISWMNRKYPSYSSEPNFRLSLQEEEAFEKETVMYFKKVMLEDFSGLSVIANYFVANIYKLGNIEGRDTKTNPFLETFSSQLCFSVVDNGTLYTVKILKKFVGLIAFVAMADTSVDTKKIFETVIGKESAFGRNGSSKNALSTLQQFVKEVLSKSYMDLWHELIVGSMRSPYENREKMENILKFTCFKASFQDKPAFFESIL
eukprot:Nk52_evm6s1869 gene=Nk52_evmTU6s1869